MTTRKLVTVCQILSISPIKNADTIELIYIKGWQVVVKKGLHKVGEYVIFCEIDSWIPTELAPFLSKGNEPREYNGVKGEKLRTIRLKGQLSQGLVMPLFEKTINKKLCNYYGYGWSEQTVKEVCEKQEDLSEILGIQKWEAPIPFQLSGIMKGNFPSFLRKTDQERIQNIWEDYKDKYNNIEFEVSLKLDGTSFTCYYYNEKFGVCSRNMELKEGENTYWKVAKEAKLEESLKKLGVNLAIQGEIIGEGIQGNPEKINGHLLKVFDVYDIDTAQYLPSHKRFQVLHKLNEDGKLFGICPIMEDQKHYSDKLKVSFKLSQFETLDDLLKFADGSSERAEIREGLVFKSLEHIDGQIISFKVISNMFLEKQKN